RAVVNGVLQGLLSFLKPSVEYVFIRLGVLVSNRAGAFALLAVLVFAGLIVGERAVTAALLALDFLFDLGELREVNALDLVGPRRELLGLLLDLFALPSLVAETLGEVRCGLLFLGSDLPNHVGDLARRTRGVVSRLPSTRCDVAGVVLHLSD